MYLSSHSIKLEGWACSGTGNSLVGWIASHLQGCDITPLDFISKLLDHYRSFLSVYSLLVCLVLIAVYDVTIGYKPRCPSLLDNVFGVNPSEVHIHVRRIALGEIPTSEKEVSAWLTNTFQLKDQLLSDFYLQGHFPQEGTEGDLSTVKCLVNFVALMMLISTFTFFTIFSSVWFKIYVSLVCCYLSSATYFNVRPKPLL